MTSKRDDRVLDTRHLGPGDRTGAARRAPARRAYTLMEVVVVMTIMGVLIAIPAPLLGRTVEQSRLDVAASNLRSIWSAQRYFYLANGRFGTLAELNAGTSSGDDLIDPSLTSEGTFYRYTLSVAADGESFLATASHPETPRCSGSITMDNTGTLGGTVLYGGQPLTLSTEFVQ